MYPTTLSSLSPTVFGAIILLGLIATKRLYDTYLGIHKIPTYGQSAPILSFLGALSFTVNAKRIIGEGYRKFTQGVFKVSTLDGWLVIVCGPRFIDEVRAAPEDTLSFVKGTHHVLSLDYTMGFGADTHGPNVLFVQQQIGRNVAELVRDIRDETAAAFSEIFPQKDDGTWSSLKGLSTCQKIVTRTTSRALVGLPLCRDKGCVQSIIDFNFALCAGAAFLHLFPEFIKPAIGLLLQMLWISPLSKLVDGYLQPLISERQRELAKEEPETGSGYVDFVKWLARRGKDSPAFITKRVQMLNLTGLHATTMHLTQTIYRLAENPTWVDALRQEIETVIDGEGWTYEAMNQLHKLDSFIEEASRLEGLGMINMHRYTLKPFMFSNGVQIPKDTYVACATHPMHLDKAIYPDADTFNPWRFSDLRTADTRLYDGSRLTTSTSELIIFGYGRHTCPARFFAVAEMKMIVAHLVLHYDVRFADESRSSRCFYATHAAVCPDVDILVRKLPMGA